MELPYSVEELRTATHELVARATGSPTCYLRPIAFYGYGELGVHTRGNPVDVVIMSWPVGRLPRRGRAQRRASRAKISSWKRVGAERRSRTSRRRPASTSTRCSPTIEAQRAGYDEAILLTDDGYVADGSGENIFVVKDGEHLDAAALDLDPARDHARHA